VDIEPVADPGGSLGNFPLKGLWRPVKLRPILVPI